MACGGCNAPGVVTLPPRPRGQVRTPDSVQFRHAAFADDGRQVLLSGYVEWDSKQHGHPGERPDGAFFVSLADVTSGKEIWKATQRAECRSPAFVPGQPWVVVWDEHGFAIWDRKTGAPIKGARSLFATWPDEGKGYFVPAAEGRRLVGWGYKVQAPRDDPWVLDLRVWELPGLREGARFGPELVRGHNLERVVPAPQGPLALLTAVPNLHSHASDQRQLRIWDTESGQVLHEFGTREEGWNTEAAAWSPNGRQLILDRFEIKGGELSRSYLVLWDAVQRKLVRSFADRPLSRAVLGGQARFLTFSADGAQAVSVDADGFFRRWDVATGKELGSARWKDGEVLGLSRDGTLAVSDQRSVWDTATGKVVRRLEETPWECPPGEPATNQANRPVRQP